MLRRNNISSLLVLCLALVLAACAQGQPILLISRTPPLASEAPVPASPATGTPSPAKSPTATSAGSQAPADTLIALESTSPDLAETSTRSLPLVVTETNQVRFAAIGDYGAGGQAEADVAALVAGWNPDFVITLGDNNYPSGSASTIDEHIGQFYCAYIYPYDGAYCPQEKPQGEINRFFPSLGNHDWDTALAAAYLDYFTLPGNERYYDFEWGPMHFFVLDSDSREPDGVGGSSIQAEWLQAGLAESESTWNVVYMHHPPYSSGLHGSVEWMRWPYREWGADLVLAGHDHTYERLEVDGLTYLVNGLGGGAIYFFTSPLPGSQFRYNEDYGALLLTVDDTNLTSEFYDRGGELIDTVEFTKP